MYTINETIKTKEYKFLNTNKHLKNNLIFLTFGGSHAYGTSTPESDVDIRGCAFNPRLIFVVLIQHIYHCFIP